MGNAVQVPNPIRFGVFEVDPRSGEVRKNGIKLKLSGQPFQVLTILLEHPGEVVSREELHNRIWPSTFVDFEHNLNTAINKIREVLGDSAENPRFVETLPRRGYRFIAPVNGITPATQGVSAGHAIDLVKKPTQYSVRSYLGAGVVLVLLLGMVTWWILSNRTPQITGSRRLTFSGQVIGPRYPFGWAESFSSLATDGNRVYYSSLQHSRNRLTYVSLSGGEQVLIPLGFYASLRHISPDGSTLLAFGAPDIESQPHLWFIPAAGGGPKRIENIDGQDGAWSPDGSQIVFARETELFTAHNDGGQTRQIATLSGHAFWLRWSPDSSRIRFTLLDQKNGTASLWQCRTDGTDLHPLLPFKSKEVDDADECCGEWSKDGRYFFYRAFRKNHPEIWVRRESFTIFSAKPLQLTTGPLDSIDAVPSANGRQLLTLEAQERSELQRLDLKTHKLMPYLPGSAATDVRQIPNTNAIAYIESHGRETTVWRSQDDGSDRLQLSSYPMDVLRITPSPDGKQIALMGKLPNAPWRIYLVSSGGGEVRGVTPADENVADATWSPDGRELMFGSVPDWWPGGSSVRKPIRVINAETGAIRNVPGSDDLWSPRWSPNGRYIVAMTRDWTKLMLFDFMTQKWTTLSTADSFDFPEWHPDSTNIYVTDHSRNRTTLVRIDRRNGKKEEILDLESLNPKAQVCWMITPPERESLLVSCTVPNGDIYALDVDLP